MPILFAMLSEFNTLLTSKDLQNRLTQGINILHHKDFPFTSYFGINYSSKGIESIKFYFIAFKKVTADRLSEFFPPYFHIRKIYETFVESKVFDEKHLGVTFGIKIDKSGQLSYSFYQQHLEHITPPIHGINLPIAEHPVRDKFYVREFNDKGIFEKHYYLLTQKENIEFMLDYFSVSGVSAENVSFMEYAEFEDKQKMVLVIPKYAALEEYIKKNNDEKFMQLNDYIQDKLGFLPEFPGHYLNKDVKTIYFFDRKKGDDFFKQSLTINKLLDKINNLTIIK